jgi:hypothetical protein
MNRTRMLAVGLLGLGLLIWTCTDTNVYHQNLEPNIPNKVTLSGTVCTDDPAQRQFPVRLMFIVDTSGWLGNSDMEQRKLAVNAVINRYIASPNYSFSIVKFGGGTKQLTSGYTQNMSQLQDAIALFDLYDPMVDGCVNGHCRDWNSALSLASSIFSGDAMVTNTGTLSRTRYVFIFVVHGPPEPPQGNATDEKNTLVAAVETMVKFGSSQGVAEVAFHGVQVDDIPGTCQGTTPAQFCDSTTPCPPQCAGSEVCEEPQRLCAEDHAVVCNTGADCSTRCEFVRVCNNDVNILCARNEDCCPTFPCTDPNRANNDRAAELLRAMSFRGGGDYQRFFQEANLSFGALKFETTQSIFVKKAFVVYNLNAKPFESDQVADSDGDGLSDQEENCYGEILSGECKNLKDCTCTSDVWSRDHTSGTDTDPAKADTDGDGLNDKLEMLFATLNVDPLRTDFPQACAGLDFPYLDRDGDGLNDCEEKLLGTDPSLFDTDRDGYPDRVEFNMGTNYLEADNLVDSDLDGSPNGKELEEHTNPQANDVMSRSGMAYRYRLVDEGLRVMPYTSQPQRMSGVEITDVSNRSIAGAGTLYYMPAGTLRSDGTQRQSPGMSWRDPHDGEPGMEVPITKSGTYLLYSACACAQDCTAKCLPGEWCNPALGACAPDPCAMLTCSSSEQCERSSGTCIEDCTRMSCGLGQLCDTWLGKCVTDRCLNFHCESNASCDPEAGVCTASSCNNWECPAGFHPNLAQKPAWISVKVDWDLLPQSGYWCDGSPDNAPCSTDADCPADTFCRIRENIVVGMANKNCISFKVKNVTLVETLETQPGFGPGQNNIFAYFAQTPLNNPRAFCTFKAALVQMKFVNGKKDPNWAEVPLGDGDFFPIEEQ